jgi:hypothetical protein
MKRTTVLEIVSFVHSLIDFCEKKEWHVYKVDRQYQCLTTKWTSLCRCVYSIDCWVKQTSNAEYIQLDYNRCWQTITREHSDWFSGYKYICSYCIILSLCTHHSKHRCLVWCLKWPPIDDERDLVQLLVHWCPCTQILFWWVTYWHLYNSFIHSFIRSFIHSVTHWFYIDIFNWAYRIYEHVKE